MSGIVSDMATTTEALARRILKRELSAYVTEKRQAGEGWERIAQLLSVDTKGELLVSGRTLSRMYGEEA
jgi:hypothetical protein